MPLPPGAPTKRLTDKHEKLAREGVGIKEACKLTKISTATYYRWAKRGESGENGKIGDFYKRVVMYRRQGGLGSEEIATYEGDTWRAVEKFQEYARELILDSGANWEPEDWQLEVVRDILDESNRAIWLVVPEGSGKTTLTAGIALYFLEHQLTPEIPVGASTVQQAETLYRQAEGFIVRTPGMIDRFKLAPGVRRIDCRKTRGHMRIYPADDRTGDGVIPSLAILDELHRHKDLRLYRTWKGKYWKRRGQVIAISTAGEPGSEFEDTRTKILKEAKNPVTKGEYAEHIRAEHESTVLHDFAVRNREDASDMEVVKAANPLSTVKIENLAAKRAEPEMTDEHWLRFTCNIPTRIEGAAVTPEQWDALFEEGVVGDRTKWCVAWVDFGWQIDTTAMGVLYWEDHDRRVIDGVRIFEPPVDEEDVVRAMVEIQNEHEPSGWVFDPAASGQMMAQQLDKGSHPLQGDTRFQMLKHKNDAAPMSIACARMDEAIRTKKIVHNGDETLRRHVLNAVKRRTVGEKFRYDRPDDAKGERRKRFPTDALIGVTMGHNHAVTEHETDKEPIAIWGSAR